MNYTTVSHPSRCWRYHQYIRSLKDTDWSRILAALKTLPLCQQTCCELLGKIVTGRPVYWCCGNPLYIPKNCGGSPCWCGLLFDKARCFVFDDGQYMYLARSIRSWIPTTLYKREAYDIYYLSPESNTGILTAFCCLFSITIMSLLLKFMILITMIYQRYSLI